MGLIPPFGFDRTVNVPEARRSRQGVGIGESSRSCTTFVMRSRQLASPAMAFRCELCHPVGPEAEGPVAARALRTSVTVMTFGSVVSVVGWVLKDGGGAGVRGAVSTVRGGYGVLTKSVFTFVAIVESVEGSCRTSEDASK